MVKRRACLKIMIIALVFGMTGCKSGNIEDFLGGTWHALEREVYDEIRPINRNISNYDYKITFISGGISEESVYMGTFEEYIGNNPICRGSYFASESWLLIQVTDVKGEYFERQGWCPVNDNEDGIGSALVKNTFSVTFSGLPLICLAQSQYYQYSISPSLQMMATVEEDTTYTVTTRYARIAGIE